MSDNQEIIRSAKVLEFLTIANEYNRIIEECSDYPEEHLFEFLQRMLPLMYLKGSLLPEINPEDPDQNERFLTEEQWENSLNNLKAVFGDRDLYWSIEHPVEASAETERRSISEDLADIYQESKDFVLLFQKPLSSAKENAVANCRYYFSEHWGGKALKAAGLIHHLLHPCCHDHHPEG